MTDTFDTPPIDYSRAADRDARSTAYDLLKAEIQPCNKTALFDALVAAGVTHVAVSFDGYGDSGQIENIEVKAGDIIVAMPEAQIEIARAEWGQSEPQRSLVSVANAIEGLAYDFLEQTHCGWENNEGAFGEFTFDVAKRTVTLDFNYRFIESEHSQRVF